MVFNKYPVVGNGMAYRLHYHIYARPLRHWARKPWVIAPSTVAVNALLSENARK